MAENLGFARARFVLPLSDALGRDRRIGDGYVLWRGDRILEVGAYSEAIGLRLLREHPGLTALTAAGPVSATELSQLPMLEGVLLPGFIKAHGHDAEPPIMGLVKDVPLTAWLDGAVNVWNKFIDEEGEQVGERLGIDPYEAAYWKSRVDDIYYGITSSMVHHCNYAKHFVDGLAKVNERAGTRMFIAVGSQDRNYYEKILDTPQEAIARLDAYQARHKDLPRTTIMPGPDQLFSNGPDMLKAQKEWAREHGTLFHCHSSEERATTAWFKETYGQTPVQYADSLGILDERTILAHQVHCADEDLDILARTGAKVVHNPLANTILGSGMPPIMTMLERGIPFSVSTDGSGSADNQNILAAARLASQYQKAVHQNAENIPAQKALELITIDAAELLGIPAGSLEPGRAADLIMVSTRRPNMVPTRLSNVVENLIWASDGSEVELVVAGGRLLRQGSDYKTLDLDAILDKVSRLSAELDRFRATQTTELRGTGAHL